MKRLKMPRMRVYFLLAIEVVVFCVLVNFGLRLVAKVVIDNEIPNFNYLI
jgi:hypothetical protein